MGWKVARAEPQPGYEGHRLPMSPRHAANDATTALGVAVEPRHLGRCSALIDKDQLGRIELRLLVLPSHPRFGHVRPLLLGCPHAFF